MDTQALWGLAGAVASPVVLFLVQWVLGLGARRRDEQAHDEAREEERDEREEAREEKRHTANDLATERALADCREDLAAEKAAHRDTRRECDAWRKQAYDLREQYGVRLEKAGE